MIVLRMRLEMLGQIGDTFGENRDLNLGGTRIVGFGRILLDERLLALGGDRHREILFFLRGFPSKAATSRDVVQRGREA